MDLGSAASGLWLRGVVINGWDRTNGPKRRSSGSCQRLCKSVFGPGDGLNDTFHSLISQVGTDSTELEISVSKCEKTVVHGFGRWFWEWHLLD